MTLTLGMTKSCERSYTVPETSTCPSTHWLPNANSITKRILFNTGGKLAIFCVPGLPIFCAPHRPAIAPTSPPTKKPPRGGLIVIFSSLMLLNYWFSGRARITSFQRFCRISDRRGNAGHISFHLLIIPLNRPIIILRNEQLLCPVVACK